MLVVVVVVVVEATLGIQIFTECGPVDFIIIIIIYLFIYFYPRVIMACVDLLFSIIAKRMSLTEHEARPHFCDVTGIQPKYNQAYSKPKEA